MSKTTKKLCYIALLVAVYVLLSMTFTIKTGNLEITFKSLPVVVAALLFGPAGGGMTALLGEFLCQVMMYGLMPTTILWLLPPVARGLVIGGAARFFWKSGCLLESRPVTCYVVCLVGSFATSCVTTACLWLDSRSMTITLCLRVCSCADPLWEGHCDRSHRDDDRDSPDEAAAPGRSGSGLKLRKEAF